MPQSSSVESPTLADASSSAYPTSRGWRFWMVFVCLMLSQFLTALEISIISTALPTIVNHLHGSQFVWIGSAYTICSTAFVPLSGGLAEAFGRRAMMLIALVFFAVGSVLCGAATTQNFLIAGRAVQGAGAGGVQSLCFIILSDLVPLKDRGVFNGLLGLAATVANSIGPVVGGALAQDGQWKWIFYLNVPICVVAAVMVLLFLTLKTPLGTFSEKLSRLDWFGNALVIASTTSLMIGLTWGGVQFPWRSAHILVPLILGLVGLAGFLFYEAKVPQNPVVPVSLMMSPTALSGYFQTLILYTVLICLIYYLPVFFQATQDASPIASGVDAFGLASTIAPSAIFAGLTVAKTHRYRPQIWVSWALVMIGAGLLATLTASGLHERAKAIGYQAILGFGLGMLCAAVFFPVLAPNSIEQNAHAIALYAFIRNFANIVGITIGGSILQNELSRKLPPSFETQFPQGTAIAYSIIPLIPTMPEPLKSQTQVAFAESLQVVWQTIIGIAGLGFLSSLLMRGLRLHTQVDEKWGLDENDGKNKRVDEESLEKPGIALPNSLDSQLGGIA